MTRELNLIKRQDKIDAARKAYSRARAETVEMRSREAAARMVGNLDDDESTMDEQDNGPLLVGTMLLGFIVGMVVAIYWIWG